jgi:REP element-mobilizing transposase RayT
LFGEMADGLLQLNDAGQMIEKWWNELQKKFPNVTLDEYIAMPNHFHGIITIVMGTQINKPVGAPLVGAQMRGAQMGAGTNGKNKRATTRVAPTVVDTGGNTVGDIVGAFKSITTNEYIRGVKNCHWKSFDGKLWQRNYWEHVIRNENDLHRIREYIVNNPYNWKDDRFYFND